MKAHGEGPDVAPRLRVAHLTTVDMSLALLLGTELQVDVEAGHEVFGISAPGAYVERIEAQGVTHVPVLSLTRAWDPRRDVAAFRELVATIRQLDLDVLHTHNPKTGVMGRIAGRIAGVPVVVNTCHGLWARPEDRLVRRIFVYGAEGMAARFSDYELFQNAEDMKTMRWALKRGRHRVVGNGVDLARFVPDPQGRAQVRAELGVADGELLVGTIGRRVREKGLVEFAHAATRLADQATFVWVGPEDDKDAAAGISGTNEIRFLGERTDMPAIYSALDVFVLASYREGFSRAAMEAAACGSAMVLTDIRGCREVGDDGTHLRLVPPKDGNALTQAINALLDDVEERSRLAAAARRRALEEFDQRSVASVSLQTYEAVARGMNGPSPSSDPRTTVLHVLPSDLDRGAQVYAGQLRDALDGDPDQRHMLISLFKAPEAALRADIKLAIPSGRLRRAGLDPRAVLGLRRAIRDHHADAVIAHGGEPLKYVVASAGRTPTIYYKVGLSTRELDRNSRTRLYQALVKRVTRVVAVSDAISDQAHDLLGVPLEKLSVIPNGRDPEVFYPPAGDEQRADPPLLLFVGQLESGKRPALFLDVAASLRSRGLAFDAAIVGEGMLRAELATRAASLDVELLGRRSDVPDLLRQATVLIMTSVATTEGMPGVLIEAGLSGLPVVSTDAAGVADVVADSTTGFVVKTDSAYDLAQAVESIITDAAVQGTMMTAARARCATRFSIEATARLWRGVVHDVAPIAKFTARSSWPRRLVPPPPLTKDPEVAR